MLGDVAGAIWTAEQSIEVADRSDMAEWRIITRGVFGDVLHQSGHLVESLAAFEDAERLQQQFFPERPLLASFHGYKYCDLLLDLLEIQATNDPASERPSMVEGCRAVRRRAESTLPENQKSLFHEALNHVTLGLGLRLEAEALGDCQEEDQPAELLRKAEKHLNRGVRLLRDAGTRVQLPRAILARKSLWRVYAHGARGAIDEKRKAIALDRWNTDLTEVESLVGQGATVVWQIDAALERVRYHCACGERDKALDRFRWGRRSCRGHACDLSTVRETMGKLDAAPNYCIITVSRTVGYERRKREFELLDRILGAMSYRS